MTNPADAFVRLLEVLDRMEIPYLVGGSMASSVHGITRPTLDADIVVDLKPSQVDEFVSLLKADFCADRPVVLDALAPRTILQSDSLCYEFQGRRLSVAQ